MYDIITFGSATSDIFLRLKKESYQILRKKKKLLCFPLGAKIFIDDLKIASGGGATNTAATFAKQGLRTAVCTKVGQDKRGEALIEELKKLNVETQFIKKDKKYSTAHSIILSSPPEDRTVLIYKGACHFMESSDIAWRKLKKVKWFYLAPLTGKSAQLFGPLVEFAKKNNIKIAANPGNSQLNLNRKILKPILSQIDILILNIEEASLLAKAEEEIKIIKKLSSLTKGIIVITKQKKGSIVFDGKYLYKAGIAAPHILPLEKTGAGDAYAAGFLTGFFKKNDIKYAIQLATANATSCILEIGAKKGLLAEGQWEQQLGPRVRVQIKRCK